MANKPIENIKLTRGWGTANMAFEKASGAGTDTDPFLPEVATVSNELKLCTVMPPLDTAQYGNGDLLLSASIALSSAVRANGGTAVLRSITIIDKDNQGAAMTVLIADRLADYGTANAAPTADDDTVAQTLGMVAFAAADYVALSGCKIATKTGLSIVCKADNGGSFLGLNAVIGASTPTYSATGLVFLVGFSDR